jgi:hypothetical protein
VAINAPLTCLFTTVLLSLPYRPDGAPHARVVVTSDYVHPLRLDAALEP